VIILNELLCCYEFACNLTSNDSLLEELDNNANKNMLVSHICNVESESISTYICLLFHRENYSDEETLQMVEQRLCRASIKIVKSYMNGLRKLHALSQNPPVTKLDKLGPASIKGYLIERVLDSKVSVISLILDHLISYTDGKLENILSFYFPIICDLCLSHSLILRSAVRNTLLRIGKLKIDSPYRYSDIYIPELQEKVNDPDNLSQNNTSPALYRDDLSIGNLEEESIEMDSAEEV